MRLFEIAPSRVDSPEGVLMTVLSFLKGKADNRASAIRVPMESLFALMSNAGYPVNFEDVKSLYDNSDTIKNFIKTIDKNEIVINTAQDDTEVGPNFVPGDETDVEQMAKRAANRRNKS